MVNIILNIIIALVGWIILSLILCFGSTRFVPGPGSIIASILCGANWPIYIAYSQIKAEWLQNFWMFYLGKLTTVFIIGGFVINILCIICSSDKDNSKDK